VLCGIYVFFASFFLAGPIYIPEASIYWAAPVSHRSAAGQQHTPGSFTNVGSGVWDVTSGVPCTCRVLSV
jgi:hypothetical protein